ncbi:hypothetical protein PP707_06105 [Acetobacter pasteurianus]|nr:hypothetical protein [Acetobacter pasteurianus]
MVNISDLLILSVVVVVKLIMIVILDLQLSKKISTVFKISFIRWQKQYPGNFIQFYIVNLR